MLQRQSNVLGLGLPIPCYLDSRNSFLQLVICVRNLLVSRVQSVLILVAIVTVA